MGLFCPNIMRECKHLCSYNSPQNSLVLRKIWTCIDVKCQDSANCQPSAVATTKGIQCLNLKYMQIFTYHKDSNDVGIKDKILAAIVNYSLVISSQPHSTRKVCKMCNGN